MSAETFLFKMDKHLNHYIVKSNRGGLILWFSFKFVMVLVKRNHQNVQLSIIHASAVWNEILLI
jgi:hypothetical protein